MEHTLLRELYLGNIGFDIRRHDPDSAFVKASRKKIDSLEALMETLDDSQKELLENYCDAQYDMEGMTRYDIFTDALRFRVLFMVEILAKNRADK